MTGRLVPVVLALALALSLTGCSSGSDVGSPGGAATASSPDDHDLQMLDEVQQAIKQWNATTGPLVRAFRDPAVTAESFVQQAQPRLATLQTLARQIATGTVGLHDTGLASALMPIGTAYQAEATDFDLLVDAASRGDEPAQQKILARLTAAGQQKAKDALAVVAYLRQKYGDAFADAFAGSDA